MVEITISAFNYNESYHAVLLAQLERFEKQTGIQVRLYAENPSLSDLKRYAMYQQGPDVSEIVTTRVNDMVAMNALRPFIERDVARFGRPEDFAPGAWETCHLAFDKTIWAIPFLTEAVLIHYRRDLFEAAGVDPQKAFQSFDALAQSAVQLSQSGVAVPVELPYWSLYDQLHSLSGWLWSAGSEYIRLDGKQVLFDRPEALNAMARYFDLIRCYRAEGVKEALAHRESLFLLGKAAVTFSSHLLYERLDRLPAEVRENWAVTEYPEKKYVGGSNLVIWKHARHDTACLELIRFLTQTDIQIELMRPCRMLPARLEGLSAPEILQDPVLKAAAASARTGRSYPPVPIWGVIEERLINTLHQIQVSLLQELANGGSPDVEETIRRAIIPLAKRMNLTLSL